MAYSLGSEVPGYHICYILLGKELQDKTILKERIHLSRCIDVEKELMVVTDVGKGLVMAIAEYSPPQQNYRHHKKVKYETYL